MPDESLVIPDPVTVAGADIVVVPAGVLDADRFRAAVAAIDAANADDPETIIVGGRSWPKERTHARLATAWVAALDPEADEAQLLAARAHHLRRWSVPRASFPAGRAGYLRWRAELKKRHAALVGEILHAHGYDHAAVERVAAIVRKEGLGRDPQVQTHEDALCLVFVQTQFDDLAGQLGRTRMVEVVAKTIAKMSPAALAVVPNLGLGADAAAIVADASAVPDR